MTEHPVHHEQSHDGTTDPSASRLPSRMLIASGLLVAALVGATLSTQQSGLAHKASVDSSRSGPAPVADPHEDRAGGRAWLGCALVASYRRRLELISDATKRFPGFVI